MRINVFGMGVVGVTTADCFRRFGHIVNCLDVDEEQLDKVAKEGFQVSSEPDSADFHFVCTQEASVGDILVQLRGVTGLPVIQSTVTPGTTKHLMEVHGIHICYNPEFLRVATALPDGLNPWRVVIGECCPTHGKLLAELYEPARVPIVRVDPTTAEMTKLTCNAYLAMLISYFNEIHLICERIGVNSHIVGKIASMDPRISSYGATQHSKPYGGHCLPRDIRTLIEFSKSTGANPILLEAVERVNQGMK
jgi:UDPglucose 6-dehydrogenase